MSRDLNASVIAALDDYRVQPEFLIAMSFNGTAVYLASTQYDVSYDSKTWLGNDWLYEVSGIEEDVDIAPTRITLKFGGLSATLTGLFLGASRAADTVSVYLAFLNVDTRAIIGVPYLAFYGYLNEVDVSEDIADPYITVEYENKLSILSRSSGIRFNHDNQQTRFPDDLGLEYVQRLQDADFRWGKTKVKPKKKKRKGKKGGKDNKGKK
jgi:hypothetical protein